MTAGYKTYDGGITAISGNTTTLEDLDPAYPHTFVGIEYYSNAAGTTIVVPTGGILSYTVTEAVLPGQAGAFAGNEIVYPTSSGRVVSFYANAISFTITGLSSLTGPATHFQVRAISNRT